MKKVLKLRGFIFKIVNRYRFIVSFVNVFFSKFSKSSFIFNDSLLIFFESSPKSIFEILGSIGRNYFVFDTFLKILIKWLNSRFCWFIFCFDIFSLFLYFHYISNQLLFLFFFLSCLYWKNSFLSLCCLSFLIFLNSPIDRLFKSAGILLYNQIIFFLIQFYFFWFIMHSGIKKSLINV